MLQLICLQSQNNFWSKCKIYHRVAFSDDSRALSIFSYPQSSTHRPLSQYSCSATVWTNTWIKHTTGINKPSSESAPKYREVPSFQKRICMLNGQGMPVQIICHTIPYNNCNFQINGASRYFGWQSVHLLILLSSFQWCVMFLCLAKLCRSCSIRDKGPLARCPAAGNWHSYYGHNLDEV